MGESEKKASYCNSWDHVRTIRKKVVANELKTWGPSIDMEQTWRMIQGYQVTITDVDGPASMLHSDYFRSDECIAKTPLEALTVYLDRGHYPPPEVLIALHHCFLMYFKFAGHYELDEMFFDAPRKQRIGNYAAQSDKDDSFLMFDYLVSLGASRANTEGFKRKSQTELAEVFLQQKQGDFDTDPESFVRDYRRWKQNRKADK